MDCVWGDLIKTSLLYIIIFAKVTCFFKGQFGNVDRMATSGTILTELAYGLCSLLNTLVQDLSDVWKGDFEKQHVNQDSAA